MTLETLLAHIRAVKAINDNQAAECLHTGNNLGYNAYIERAIALEDVLTWVDTHERTDGN